MSAPAFSSPDRATRVGVVVLTIAVLAAVVAGVTLRLRDGLRQQILTREAATLTAFTTMQLANAENTPAAGFFAVVRTSTLHGVKFLRAFDEQKVIQGSWPYLWTEDPPPAADWDALAGGRSVARLRMNPKELKAALAELLLEPSAENLATPLFEVWVPLRRSETAPILGVAQFWIDGTSVAGELAALNRHLFTQAVLAWLAGALIIVAVLAWALRRLSLANQELRVRSENLQRANRELVLAAKTSALGSVTAHLIHALKNPIAGLEVFVASQAEPAGKGDGKEELAAATELTRRLRTMVNDVVSVLRDEQGGVQFELSSEELVELALAKIRPFAASRDVLVKFDLQDNTLLLSRRANLAALSLYNLLQNAIEVSPAHGAVQLASRSVNGGVEFTVADKGPGLPTHVRERLFEPCVSTKLGGSGLGLALSQQIARQAGGRIELVRSDAQGTCFRLVLDSVG